MKVAIKFLVKIIFISFGFDVVVSQELKKGMTFDDVEEVWGKPKSISEPKFYNKGDNNNKKIKYWQYGKDTTLTFHDEKIKYIWYPFKAYYKRLKQGKANDTLKDCSLFVFFYDTIQNKYIYTKPGIGKFNFKFFPNYELRAFYKTPNSYQRIDSVKWHVPCAISGFQEAAASSYSFLSKAQISVLKKRNEPTFFLYFEKTKLKSGYIIDYPKIEDESFIYEGYTNTLNPQVRV